MAKAKSVTVNWNLNKVGQARYKDEAYKMFYTKVMRGEKRLKGEVKNVDVDEFLRGVDTKDVDYSAWVANIQSGTPVSIPFIDEVHGKKRGVKRVLACKELGIKEVPCLVCKVAKKKTKKD